MDIVLKDVLDTISITTAVYFRTDFRTPYAIRVPAYERAARFHMAVRGDCLVRIDDGTEADVAEGDLVLIPNGASHVITCGREAPEILLDDALCRTGYEGHGPFVFGPDSDEQGCQLVCGHFAFAKGADHPLLGLLPSIVHISREKRRAMPLLDEMAAMVERQVFNDDPDAAASFGRLSEALFIEILRAASQAVPRLATLFAAISDAQLGRALAAIHADVGAPWTVEALAGHAAMSRTRFAERFRALVGMAPMAYLTEWRLQRGLKMLADGKLPVKTIAAQVGYKSAAAFSRAFTQRFGERPSSVGRNEAAAAVD